MLEAYDGRINRTTFVAGNAIALGALVFLTILVMVPLAVVGLFVHGGGFNAVADLIKYALIFPLLIYYYYFSVLLIKRAHDVGWPGLLMFFAFTILIFAGLVLHIPMFNIVAFITLMFFALKPGQKTRNQFGTKPGKGFVRKDLVVKL